jgi:hypothetical protein
MDFAIRKSGPDERGVIAGSAANVEDGTHGTVDQCNERSVAVVPIDSVVVASRGLSGRYVTDRRRHPRFTTIFI